jgi:hypothetical protein
VTAIRAPNRRPHSKPAFGKIQSIANRSPHAIIGNPADVFGADSALQYEILGKAPNWIVRKRGNYSSVQTKATLQPPCNVVFPAAFPDAKIARSGNAFVARVQP